MKLVIITLSFSLAVLGLNTRIVADQNEKVSKQMKTRKVVTYQSPRGNKIDLTPAQVRAHHKAGTWPKDWDGQQYCQVSHGLHSASELASR